VFLLFGVLVGNFSSVVLVLAGAMGDGWEDLSVACDQNIQSVAILVHRSPKMMAFAAGRDEHFVHVLNVAGPGLVVAAER